MPPWPGFSDNPFRDLSDFMTAAISLTGPLDRYKSATGARIKIATFTGAGFSETAAQLEGFSRPLWTASILLRLRSINLKKNPSLLSSLPLPEWRTSSDYLNTWAPGLKEGTNPASPDYWGDVSSFDQRMVEMETIAVALLIDPETFSFADDGPARGNLVRWLSQINDHAMPQNNWLWFRVLVNLALVRSLDVPLHQVKAHIDEALEILDTFYIGEGWSSDGAWGDLRKQADYYSGSFAMQFAQCLFVKFAAPLAEYADRIERYKSQAREFAVNYWRYFDVDGAAIPFGRSLTYRFAFAAFWSAVAFADIRLPDPLSVGVVKGLLFRHLRWWAKQPHVFNVDGTINIGYCYPNMYMAEDYNSPQSVYWCLKSFLVLNLSCYDAFWQSKEEAHPLASKAVASIERVKWLAPPRHIMVNMEEHHYLLSSGQSTTKRFKAREAKYGKFAYSSAFGFSVPCGLFLEQIAPDSTLAVSFNDGEEDWKVRWEPYDVESGVVHIAEQRRESMSEAIPTLTSKWKPWKREGVVVQTTLVALAQQWPGWHLRAHRVQIPKRRVRDGIHVRFVDGGFAVSAQTSLDTSLFEQAVQSTFPEPTSTRQGLRPDEGWWNNGEGSLVISEAGASGVVDLTEAFVGEKSRCESIVIRSDPNTNIMYPRTLIPALQHSYSADLEGSATDDNAMVFWMVTGVFAIQENARDHMERVWDLWKKQPTGRIVDGDVELSAS